MEDSLIFRLRKADYELSGNSPPEILFSDRIAPLFREAADEIERLTQLLPGSSARVSPGELGRNKAAGNG